MTQLLWIALCGALGAVSRYGLSYYTHRICGANFPYGTLVVNVTGCFVIGLFAGKAFPSMSAEARHALSVGFLGALTTFSTFGLETVMHLEEGRGHIAAGNVIANLLLGLLAVWIGLGIARNMI